MTDSLLWIWREARSLSVGGAPGKLPSMNDRALIGAPSRVKLPWNARRSALAHRDDTGSPSKFSCGEPPGDNLQPGRSRERAIFFGCCGVSRRLSAHSDEPF